jgi:5'-3' exonuclease
VNQIVLVDFMNVYYRSYYSFPEMQNIYEEERFLTGPMFGTLSTISYMKRKYKCPVLVATEPEDNSDRFQLYKDYKAGRSKKDPAIFRLKNETLRALALFRDVFVLSSDDSGEADDIIFTFIRHNATKFDRFNVLSSDNDLLQIASIPELKGKVFYAPKNRKEPEELSFETYCQEKYEISPDSILLYKCVKGDDSDNLPRAGFRLQYKLVREWVQKSHSLEEFKSVLTKNKSNKHAETILSNWDIVEKNYQIMKLKTLRLKNITNTDGKDATHFVTKYAMQSLVEMLET